MYFENVFIKSNIFHINIYNINDLKKQVRRGTYRESENLLRSIDIW